jgi:hypothetical protein
MFLVIENTSGQAALAARESGLHEELALSSGQTGGDASA